MKQYLSVPIIPIGSHAVHGGASVALGAEGLFGIQELIEQYRDTHGGMLPLLHALQDRLGYVPEGLVPAIAQTLNLSRAEVHGVLTYYHHFRTTPPGRHVLQVCRAESCKACGGDALLALVKRVLDCDVHETSVNGAVTLEPVFCLGLCASSPVVRLDDQMHARMSEDKLRSLLHGVECA